MRLGLASVVLLLGALLPACAESDDRADRPAFSSTAATDQATTAEPEGGRLSKQAEAPPTGETDARPAGRRDAREQEVENVVEGVYRDLGAGNSAGVCAALTKAVRQEVARNVIQGKSSTPANARTCTASIAMFMDVAASSGGLRSSFGAEVEEVKIDGMRAIAKVTLGGHSGNVRLVREDGAWRFGSTPVGS